MAKITKTEQTESIEYLRGIVNEKTTLYYTTDYAKSGMTRWTKVYIARVDDDGKSFIQNITFDVGRITGGLVERDGRRAIKHSGCGYNQMDDISRDIRDVLGLTDMLGYSEL